MWYRYFFHHYIKEKIKIHKEASIFTAEALAIDRARNITKDQNVKTLIISDSLTVLEAILNQNNKNYLINKIQLVLERIRQIKTLWIPSHIGINGNDTADELAKNSISNPDTESTKLDFTDVIKLIKNKMYPSIKTNLTTLTRKQQITLNRSKIGHTIITHGHIFARAPQPGCNFCQI